MASHQALPDCADRGDIAAVKSLLSTDSSLARTARSSDGATALMRACNSGHPEVVKLLLPLSDLEDEDKWGYHPLHHACLNGHENIVRLLLNANAVTVLPNKDGKTPTKLAEARKCTGIVKLLADKKSSTEQLVNLLIKATEENKPWLLRKVLAVSTDLAKQKDGNKNTALHRASAFGHLECVKILLSYSDIEAMNNNDMRAIHLAAEAGHTDVVEYLLEHGANRDVTYGAGILFSGYTPLDLAKKFKRDSCVQLLSTWTKPNPEMQSLRTEVDRLAAELERIKAATEAELDRKLTAAVAAEREQAKTAAAAAAAALATERAAHEAAVKAALASGSAQGAHDTEAAHAQAVAKLDAALKEAERQATASQKQLETVRQEVEAERRKSEAARQQAETAQRQTDAARQEADALRNAAAGSASSSSAQINEVRRVANADLEAERATAEQLRQQLEVVRREADAARRNAELQANQRIETTRAETDAVRQLADQARQQAERERADAQTALQRAKAELSALQQQSSAEGTQTQLVQAKTLAESAQQQLEEARAQTTAAQQLSASLAEQLAKAQQQLQSQASLGAQLQTVAQAEQLAQLEQARAQAAEAQQQSEAQLAKVEQARDQAQAQVATLEAQLAEARETLSQTASQLDEARAREAQLLAELEAAKIPVPPAPEPGEPVLSSHWVLNAADIDYVKPVWGQNLDSCVSFLGSGAYKNVFRGTWRGAPVAVAVLHKTTEKSRAEWAREVEILLRIRHPNILTCYGATRADTTTSPILVCELMEGGSLAMQLFGEENLNPLQKKLLGVDVLSPLHERISEADLCAIAIDVCSGLLYLHSLGGWHRDIKPGNILLDASLQHAKITDFGLARVRENMKSLDETSSLQGTTSHMAPEVLKRSASGKTSDYFSFGITLHEIASGQRAWHNIQPANVSQFVCVEGARPPVSSIRDQRWRPVIEAMWQQEPTARLDFEHCLRRLEALRIELQREPPSTVSAASPPSIEMSPSLLPPLAARAPPGKLQQTPSFYSKDVAAKLFARRQVVKDSVSESSVDHVEHPVATVAAAVGPTPAPSTIAPIAPKPAPSGAPPPPPPKAPTMDQPKPAPVRITATSSKPPTPAVPKPSQAASDTPTGINPSMLKRAAENQQDERSSSQSFST